MTPRIVIVGGGGFVGRAVQRAFLRSGDTDGVLIVDRTPTAAEHGLSSITLDLASGSANLERLAKADLAIWVAGSADHALGDRDPVASLEANVVPLLRLLSVFRGHLVMLSSQAVYFGLPDPLVDEQVDHVPTMPYGLAKLVAEKHATFSLESGLLRSLWIHRLMYAFGPGEPARRLLPRLVAGARSGQRVRLHGGGRSYLNPLPVDFLGDVLRRSGMDLAGNVVAGSVVTNICHREPWTVAEVAQLAHSVVGADVELVHGGERWPVLFQGDPSRLEQHLGRWGLALPDVKTDLVSYLEQLQKES